ncbi:MAG: LLM class F420-dependent oxidoreductase [Dehalococcoidia bacterium]
MEFGVHLPQMGIHATREHLIRFSQLADRLGYHSGWVSDHIAWPQGIESEYPYSANGDFPAPNTMPWLDPLGTLIFAAAVTERLRLGTTVLILGYRPPVQTAKLIATLDAVSNGRAILGVGVGWMREEFDALGMPFDHRGSRADEQLDVFEELFTKPEPANEGGRFYPFPKLGFSPKPPQGHVPIWVGGDTEAAFRRVVRYGDTFHAAFTPLAKLREGWARIRQLAEQSGRDPATIGFSTRVYLDFDGVMDPEKSLAGSPAKMLEQLATYRAAGIQHLGFDIVARGGAEGREEAAERFAAEVMPHAPS